MKKLFTSLFLFAVTTASFNTYANNSDTAKLCEHMRTLSYNVMSFRQVGAEQQEVRNIFITPETIALSDITNTLIKEAYALPVGDTIPVKVERANMFADNTKELCLNTMTL